MPKISDEKRESRRRQILEAAWTCFQKEGLHVTTMDDIIRSSGLSAGAVYSYFASKDELILAAVTGSLASLAALVEPLLRAEPLPSPDRFVSDIAAAVDAFTERGGYDLKRIALLGWSEAQRNERLRQIMRTSYTAFRSNLAGVVARWKGAGMLGKDADPVDVAKLLMSLVLGYVVQSALIGDVKHKDLANGLRALAAPTLDASKA